MQSKLGIIEKLCEIRKLMKYQKSNTTLASFSEKQLSWMRFITKINSENGCQ